MLNRKWMWLVLVALCYSIVGCNGGGGGGGDSADLTVTALEVTPADASIAMGTTLDLTATGILSDSTNRDMTASVTWSSSDPGVATISNGVATAQGVGVTTITATQGNISYETTLTVTDAVLVSIAVTPTNPDIALGTSQQFTATGTFSDSSTQNLTTAVTWNSDSEATATISNDPESKGSASSVSVGTTTITATLDGIFGSTDLTVTDAVLVSIAVTPTNPDIALGTSQQFTATGTFSDSSTQNLTTAVTWSSDSEATATISNDPESKGSASSVSVGTTTITATLDGIFGSTDLTVTDAVLVSIEITPANPSIDYRSDLQLTAKAIYSHGSPIDITTMVKWSSTDPSIVGVSNAGLVSTKNKSGKATITTEPYGGMSGTTTVSVPSL